MDCKSDTALQLSMPRKPTELALDSFLVERAFDLSGLPTASEAVAAALREYIENRTHSANLTLFQKLEWCNFDYKSERDRGWSG
jgi:hypothetical protein